jgi:hypothetical protein
MTIQTINIGNLVNDGLGDDLRTAFQKVNANFSSLAAELTVTVGTPTASGVNIFKEKIGSELIFKSLVAGTKMQVADTGDSVVFNNLSPDAFTRFDTDAGVLLASSHQEISLQGIAAPGSTSNRPDIEVTSIGQFLNFKTILPVSDILETADFGPINGAFTNAVQFNTAASNVDFGTVLLPGRIDLDLGSIV